MSTATQKSETAPFSSISDKWWDENGPFSPLHRLNPTRLQYIRDTILCHLQPENATVRLPLSGLKILDIGCGGGLVCEPLARMGATTSGIDADAGAIATASDHAALGSLPIHYRCVRAENLLPDESGAYDVVLALELIEHVADPLVLLESCAALVRPGGLVVVSTLNKTLKSFALGIVAAEYVLKWVPKGTHNWNQFVKPSALSRMARQTGLRPCGMKGLVYNPVTGSFSLSDTDMDVNYFMTFAR